jgi:3-hydroxyacyl-[acyl-carrier-protein] dehydratase
MDSPEIVGTCRVSETHPAFAGHFPGQPVLPGVALLAEVMELLLAHRPALARGDWVFETVKFLSPVGPGAQLRVMLRPQGDGHAFEVSEGATAVARGRLTAAS